MKIRQLRIDDYKEIIALWSRAGLGFKPKGRDSKEALMQQMEANPEFFLGAFEDDCLVGTVFISCDMRKVWINRLAVDPNYRRRGVARTLILESEKILRKRGIRIFCALIENNNVASKELFMKCGYINHPNIIYFSKRDYEEI